MPATDHDFSLPHQRRYERLEALLSAVVTGHLGAPEFVAPIEKWGESEALELLEAVVKGGSIGELVLVQTGDVPGWASRPLLGGPVVPERYEARECVVDGARRLFLLADLLSHPVPGGLRHVDIRRFGGTPLRQALRRAPRPHWGDMAEAEHAEMLFPLSMTLRSDSWLEGCRLFWLDHMEEVRQTELPIANRFREIFIDRVRGAQVPVVRLSRETGIEEARQLRAALNGRGGEAAPSYFVAP